MRILAIASQKSGSGKTTLSEHLAVQAHRVGPSAVVLMDIDPQGSRSDWWNERTDVFPATFPEVEALAAQLPPSVTQDLSGTKS
ncbi:ParA family protein [Sphingomonas jeddahensis]|uniref:CobQ/CobB/MinD/ParA nucleotide binding domain protein n=1 Tax=Sphingomonas jeddahensis TaxID=1915074 RepID=A0A1V2EUK3_9SPHN|nr:CobQ/CobB/MinD/ParA nucleotide binding domain protein [Sphingomonas jeddahensis]